MEIEPIHKINQIAAGKAKRKQTAYLSLNLVESRKLEVLTKM